MNLPVQIFSADSFWDDFWPVADFRQAYANKTGSFKYALLALGNGNPDKTGLIIVRLFIEALKADEQKFVLGLRFYSYGDLASLDIISLNLSYHRDIIMEHAQRMNWSLVDNVPDSNKFTESHVIPMAFAGGWLDKNGKFFATSTDYGNKLFIWNSNELAMSAAKIVNSGEIAEVHPGLVDLLDFMRKNKNNSYFYERFYSHIINTAVSQYIQIHPQQLGALVAMKVFDRVLRESINPIHAFVEESATGLGREMILRGVAAKFQKR